MKNSRLILLIVPQHSRGIAIMALAAHLIGLRAKLVLCVQTLPEDCIVSGEQVGYSGILTHIACTLLQKSMQNTSAFHYKR